MRAGSGPVPGALRPGAPTDPDGKGITCGCRSRKNRMRFTFASVRDIVLLILGLALLGHETVIAEEPRVALLTIAAAMIGLPATLLADRRFTSGSSSPPPSEPDSKDPAGDSAGETAR